MAKQATAPDKPKPRLERFRRRLAEKGIQVPERTLLELEWNSARLVRLYLSRPNRLRPSAMARELRAMAKGLARAAKAAEAIGEDGMVRVLLASEVQSVPDYPEQRSEVVLERVRLAWEAKTKLDYYDGRPDVDYMYRMARGAERAAATEKDMAKSARDDKGARRPDYNLQSLITLLMSVFQEMLAVRPTHTWSELEGCSDSLFDSFVHDAIESFRPPTVKITPRKIDDIIQRQLPGRDYQLAEELDDPEEFLDALERAESERANSGR